MQAACYGHLTCVMLLAQYKADIKLCNSWGASALVGAAQGGFDTVVQVHRLGRARLGCDSPLFTYLTITANVVTAGESVYIH